MSTNPAAIQPLSDSTQLGLRLPVILLALVGVVLALVFIRRYGALSAILGALGSAVVAVDQILNVIWVYTTTAQSKQEGISADTVVSTQNGFAILDAVLITIGVAVLLAGFLVRRRPAPRPESRRALPLASTARAPGRVSTIPSTSTRRMRRTWPTASRSVTGHYAGSPPTRRPCCGRSTSTWASPSTG